MQAEHYWVNERFTSETTDSSTVHRFNKLMWQGWGDTLQHFFVSSVAVRCPWGSMFWKWCLIRSCWCSIIVTNHMVVMSFRLSNPHYCRADIQCLSLSLLFSLFFCFSWSFFQSSLSYASLLFVIVGKFLKLYPFICSVHFSWQMLMLPGSVCVFWLLIDGKCWCFFWQNWCLISHGHCCFLVDIIDCWFLLYEFIYLFIFSKMVFIIK